MDILKLRKGEKLLAELDKLNDKKREYYNCIFRVCVSTRYLDITEDEEKLVRKIFTDKLEAKIAEIERKIEEL